MALFPLNKSHADRLLREFHSLNEVSLEILDELEAVAAATTSLLRQQRDSGEVVEV